ncbi:MAG: dihydroorotase [Patescibacteria group bacterium]|jgi:dihydroorotase
MNKIIIRKPDDFHVHLRNGEMLKNIIHATDSVFARVLAMGNLPEPVATAEDVVNYRNEIMSAAEPGFEPIMTIMLVNKTTPEIAEAAYREAGVKVLKLIPGDTSTGSDQGVSLYDLEKYYPVLKKAGELGMIFSVHLELAAEKDGTPVPFTERERRALPFFEKLIKTFPSLKIVAEHITTRELIEIVNNSGPNVAGSLTYHHATITAGDVLDESGSVKNAFNLCMPVAKSEDDRRAVIEAMVSGNPKFFFGSDSAPHPLEKKQSPSTGSGQAPPAGIFTAPVALPGLAEIFEREGKLEELENFVSRFGAEFYGLPLNIGTVELVKEDWKAPEMIGNVKVFRGGEMFKWKVSD